MGWLPDLLIEDGNADLELLDLADPCSVASFADRWGDVPLDLLVCSGE